MAIDNLLRLLVEKLPKPLAATVKFCRPDGSQWQAAAELLGAVLEEAVRQDTISETQQSAGGPSQQQQQHQHQGHSGQKYQGGHKKRPHRAGGGQGKGPQGGGQGQNQGSGSSAANGHGNGKPWKKQGGGKWKDRMQRHGTKGGK